MSAATTTEQTPDVLEAAGHALRDAEEAIARLREVLTSEAQCDALIRGAVDARTRLNAALWAVAGRDHRAVRPAARSGNDPPAVGKRHRAHVLLTAGPAAARAAHAPSGSGNAVWPDVSRVGSPGVGCAPADCGRSKDRSAGRIRMPQPSWT